VRSVLGGVVAGSLVALSFLAAAILLAPGDSAAPTRSPLSTITLPSSQTRETPGLATASSIATAGPSAIGTEVGQIAPDFALRSLDGPTVHLSDYRGRPVWINFWASWCPPCRDEMPRLEGVYLAHVVDGLVVLGVGVRDSESNIRAFVREVGVTYPIVLDEPGDVAGRFRAFALPVQYFIDHDGVVRGWAFGELPLDQYDPSLAKILASPSPTR
jgi:thiol-disulfide isomerase/thioredoxin